jgi:hypothetical protein
MDATPVQQRLELYEDVYEALREVVRALGGPKDVGKWLFPHLPVDDAKNRINDCLNRNRRDKFDTEQLVAILRRGREVGCHAAMNFVSDQAGYRAIPIDPREEKSRAVEEVAAARASLDRAVQALDRAVAAETALRVVKA